MERGSPAPLPAVVNISFRFEDASLNDAIHASIEAGFVYTLSAGTAGNVSRYWGSQIPNEALVVAGTDRDDTAKRDDYGPALTLFAPAPDLAAAFGIVRQLQPGAVIASESGPDVWTGTSATTTMRPGADRPDAPWTPREVSVSLRPRWNWRQSENEHVKSLEQLEELWYATVGQGALLLLNVPIDNRGQIADPDAHRLLELRHLRLP